MSIAFACKKCGQKMELDEASAGKIVQCPSCTASLLVPPKVPGSRPAVQPPALARKGSQPSFLAAAAIAVVALLMGSCAGYLWGQHGMAKAEAQAAAASALFDEKTAEVARVDAQLAAIKSAWGEKTTEVARVEAQLAAARATLDATIARNQTAYQPTPQPAKKAKKKKKK